MKKAAVLILTGLMLLTGCSSIPTKDIHVDALTDPKSNLSGYKTYAWSLSAAILNDAHGQWEPQSFDADAEIKYLIDRELRKRGLSENAASADMVVAFAAGIDMDALELKMNPKGNLELLNVPRGGLAVLLQDSQTGHMIWMGVAAGDIQDRPDEKVAKARLDYAVTKMFKKLPK